MSISKITEKYLGEGSPLIHYTGDKDKDKLYNK
jgi:hypothetical protein